MLSGSTVFLHRKALASKSLPSEMDCGMESVIKVLNSIEGKALWTRIFRKISEDTCGKKFFS